MRVKKNKINIEIFIYDYQLIIPVRCKNRSISSDPFSDVHSVHSSPFVAFELIALTNIADIICGKLVAFKFDSSIQ